jgi:C-terminal processing protease CtpA/Prc
MDRRFAQICTKVLPVALCFLAMPSWGQNFTSRQRGDVLSMLGQISPDIRKHYYDPKLNGVNWDGEVVATEQKIKQANSESLATAEIAAALLSFNDSHTFFVPPAYAARFDYGWQGRMIGDKCFVIHVRPGSDAEKKGVKPGDEVMQINGYIPTRDNFWKMQYSFNVLRPLSALILGLRDPGGNTREVKVVTRIIPEQQVLDATAGDAGFSIWDIVRQEETEATLGGARFVSVGDVGILKLPSFEFDKDAIDRVIGMARKHPTLVLDLRGNPGGAVETLQYALGACFEKEVKIGDRIGRSHQKPLIAKTHYHPFTGKLVVLIDSKSASAAELFARVIQIEKRGVIIGDRSSGSVMEAKQFTYQSGTESVFAFGASISEDAIVMADGKNLEHHGVVPDEVLLPTGEDLIQELDPVLAHAVAVAGGKISPETAGKLFPYEWPTL